MVDLIRAAFHASNPSFGQNQREEHQKLVFKRVIPTQHNGGSGLEVELMLARSLQKQLIRYFHIQAIQPKVMIKNLMLHSQSRVFNLDFRYHMSSSGDFRSTCCPPIPPIGMNTATPFDGTIARMK